VAKEVGEREPFAEYLAGWVGPWNFAGPEETERRLVDAGFSNVRAWLDPHPVVPDHTLEYLRTVCLGHHVLRLPEPLRDEYVAAVAKRCGSPVELDYVRLNIEADV
jgi:trans-aconitate 2-methyltransferase